MYIGVQSGGGDQGRIQEFKKGVRNLIVREAREIFFFAPPAKLLRTPPPYRAVANRISKNSEKKGLFVRKKD